MIRPDCRSRAHALDLSGDLGLQVQWQVDDPTVTVLRRPRLQPDRAYVEVRLPPLGSGR